MKIKPLFFAFFIFCGEALADTVKEKSLSPLFVGEEKADKVFTHRLVSDIGFNDNYQTTNESNQYKETFARARLYSSFDLGKNFSLNSQIVLSPFDKVNKNQGYNRMFESEGILLRQLDLQYNSTKYSVAAGKLNLNYGKAWKWDRGMWAWELADNYRQLDKIGFASVYKAGDAKRTGQYNFGIAFFKNDRKYLDNSLITQNDSPSKSDARPGDANFAKSYLLSMDVNFDFGEGEKLSYNFAYISMGVNQRATSIAPGKVDDQKGYLAGMNYIYPVTPNYNIDALVEYNEFKNVGGDGDVGEKYFTGSFINRFYNKYLATIAYSKRTNSNLINMGFEQELAEFSVGYEFGKNEFFDKFLIQTGYKNMRNNYKNNLETNNSFGILARYYKNF